MTTYKRKQETFRVPVASILHKDKKLAQQMGFDCRLQGLTKAIGVQTSWLGVGGGGGWEHKKASSDSITRIYIFSLPASFLAGPVEGAGSYPSCIRAVTRS